MTIDIDFTSFPEAEYPKRGEKVTGRIIGASVKIPSGVDSNKDNRLWQVVIAPNQKIETLADGTQKSVDLKFKKQGNDMENMLFQKAFTEWTKFGGEKPLETMTKSSQIAIRDLKRLAKACGYDKIAAAGEPITVSPNVVKAINDDGVAKIPETFTPPKGLSLAKIASGDWSDLAKMLATFVGKEVVFVTKVTNTGDHEVMNIYDPQSREAAAAGLAVANKTDEVMTSEDEFTPEEMEETRKSLGLNGHSNGETKEDKLVDEPPFEV